VSNEAANVCATSAPVVDVTLVLADVIVAISVAAEYKAMEVTDGVPVPVSLRTRNVIVWAPFAVAKVGSPMAKRAVHDTLSMSVVKTASGAPSALAEVATVPEVRDVA